MGKVFDSLQRASFGTNEFPVEEAEMIGEMRDAIHEFWKSPGGQPELGGRKNWLITMLIPFFATYPSYPGLWPAGCDAMMHAYEKGSILDLHVPTVGTIKCHIRHFKRKMKAEEGGGERVEVTFVENDPDDVVLGDLVGLGVTGLKAQKALLDVEAGKVPGLLSTITGALSAMDDAVNGVLAIKDQANVYALQLESRIERLANQCDELDRLLDINSYGGARVIDALHDLWGSAIKLQKDLLGKHSELQYWTTPSLMSAAEVSTKLYGDTSHQIELLQLNAAVDDAFAIAPNTKLRYYPPEAA